MVATALPTDFEAVYQALDEDERAEYLELVQRRYDQQSLREFIPTISPHLPPPQHTKILTDLFERARHERVRACVSWPPRHAKTITCLHAFAWWLAYDPADTCAYFTYSDRQGRSKSRLARGYAERAGVALDPKTQDMAEWRTLQGGGLLAGGRGGGLTGQGVSGVFVIDDPFKNRKEADSLIVREDVWEWFTEVVTTRLEGASCIVIHTRWHEDDLIGRLVDMSDELPELVDFETINLPALAEHEDPADDLLGRSFGQALWPEKENEDDLAQKKAIMGRWSFDALYQGRPRPKGANVFGDPTYYNIDEFKIDGCNVVLGGDPAATKSSTADYSTAVIIAVRPEERVLHLDGWAEPRRLVVPVGYIQHVYREQVTVPKYVADVRNLQMRWYNAKLGIESVGGFKAVAQTLRVQDPDLRVAELPALGDKFQRSQSAAAAWNAGLLMVPVYGDGSSPPWVKPFLKEICNFTGVNDATDDQVDGLAHAWNQVAYAPKPVRRRAQAVPSRWR